MHHRLSRLDTNLIELCGPFYRANTGSYHYFHLNWTIFTASGQQWWRWTQLLWATGSWRDAGRMGSSQCFLHLYRPEGWKERKNRFQTVGPLPPSRWKIGCWKKNNQFKNNWQCLLFNIVYHQNKNGVSSGFSLCQELEKATWCFSWRQLWVKEMCPLLMASNIQETVYSFNYSHPFRTACFVDMLENSGQVFCSI